MPRQRTEKDREASSIRREARAMLAKLHPEEYRVLIKEITKRRRQRHG